MFLWKKEIVEQIEVLKKKRDDFTHVPVMIFIGMRIQKYK